MENSNSFPKVSIIMPVRFRPDLLQVALDSLFKYTKNFELIIVQDGIESGIKEVLDNHQIDKFIQHKEAKGYPVAINAGFKQVSNDSDYVMFLNSDVVCTPNWLDEMIKAFAITSKVGLVAPTYSESIGIQSIERNVTEQGDYSFANETQLKGVCFLLKKIVCDDLISNNTKMKTEGNGILDERFGMGGGDDNDLCMRLKQLKYELVVARKSFVYHYNSASFRELLNHDIPLSKKQASLAFSKFIQKWKAELGYKPRIFIAIPCHDGYIHYQLVLRLLQWSHDPEIEVKIRFCPYLSPLDHCRNQAVKDFLEEYFDYLCFIDNDIVPPDNCLRDLIAANKDIIAPVCFAMRPGDDGIPFPMPIAHRYDKDRKYRPYYGKGIEETDVVTGGMHLVKREVYEKMDRPYAFTYHANGTVIYSEDFVFSQNCQQLGYKLYTHFGLLCSHHKSVDVKGVNDLMVKYGRPLQ